MADDGLLGELDLLASLSSVEAYYAAELPVLHATAILITGQPDDRTGRFSALRESLTQAFDRIDDESYAGAAHALLGYSDRWRSVRDRSTDAGRAFTPSVSYDAFRRKSGRNYRENTLRMVADALRELRQEAVDSREQSPAVDAALPTTASSNTPTRTASAAVGDEIGAPSSGNRAADDARSGRPLGVLAVLGIAALLGVLGWSLWGGTSEDQLASSFAAGEVDFARHCRTAHADAGDLFGEEVDTSELGWVCRDAAGSVVRDPDLEQLCFEQYGPSARPDRDAGADWQCVIALDDLTQPNQPDGTAGSCPVAVGAFDRAAQDRFGRFANRFRTAFDEADLPKESCGAEPLHLYGDPDLSGVTQRLVHDGRIVGAIVADDPLNVTVLSGGLWTVYEAVRGVPIYRAGLSGLENRVGYPMPAVPPENGVWRTDLSSRGALVSRASDDGYVWLPSLSLQLWLAFGGAEGCLGFPTRSPFTVADAAPEQEFENVTVRINPETAQPSFDPPGVCP